MFTRKGLWIWCLVVIGCRAQQSEPSSSNDGLYNPDSITHASEKRLCEPDYRVYEKVVYLTFEAIPQSQYRLVSQGGVDTLLLKKDYDNLSYEFWDMSGQKIESPGIRDYYPDYDIYVFNSHDDSDEVLLQVCDQWYRVEDAEIEALSWNSFLKEHVLLKLSVETQLKGSPDDSAISFQLDKEELKALSYEVVDVRGDWLIVKCNSICEGCLPDMKASEGWIRWKKDGKTILQFYYVC